MENILHFAVNDSVLLLNGSFVQSAASVRYPSDEPLFVTVLPLEANNLPYTVEILDGKAVTNRSLALCCDMGEGHCYIELRARSAYVYSRNEQAPAARCVSVPAQFFAFVREGNFAAARSMMTGELSESLSDDAIRDFFEGVTALRENTFTARKGYIMIKDDGTAQLCDIALRDGLIENIVL